MTTRTPQIRRRANGTIDIDHYRDHALLERKAVISGSLRGTIAHRWPLLTAIASIAAAGVAVPSTSHGRADSGASAIVTLAAR